MGLFSRFWNLITGFISMMLGRAEKNNPEIAYENAVNTLTAKYVQLKKAAGTIIRRRESVFERLKIDHEHLKMVEQDLSVAVDDDQDEIAVSLIQRQELLSGEVSDLEIDLEDAKADAEEVKQSLTAIKVEIERLKDEKDRMLAKKASADARIQIQEQLEGISVDAEIKALTDVRESIMNRVAESKVTSELGDSILDTKLRAIRERGNREKAFEKLEQLKNAKTKALPPATNKRVINASFEKVTAKKI